MRRSASSLSPGVPPSRHRGADVPPQPADRADPDRSHSGEGRGGGGGGGGGGGRLMLPEGREVFGTLQAEAQFVVVRRRGRRRGRRPAGISRLDAPSQGYSVETAREEIRLGVLRPGREKETKDAYHSIIDGPKDSIQQKKLYGTMYQLSRDLFPHKDGKTIALNRRYSTTAQFFTAVLSSLIPNGFFFCHWEIATW